MRWGRGILALCALAACDGGEPGEVGGLPFDLRPVSFAELASWETETLGPQAAAIASSCSVLTARPDDSPANAVERFDHPDYATLSGAVGDWRQACDVIADAVAADADSAALREALERAFVPVEIEAPEALFTGYFEPSYQARREPVPPYIAPVLGVPSDLVTADLGAFSPDFAGRDLVGRLEGNRLVPYADAAEIAVAPPDAPVLGYADPNDLLFLQIQGSGRLVFGDGSVLRAGYAGKNGRPYVPIGRTLVADGALALEDVSMQSIRAWLDAASPEEAARVRHSNPSYVFFRALALADPDGGPIGAQGVQLTGGVSLAVDRRYHAMGLPVWLETEATAANPAIRGLFVAQDTGGAIRGPVRGDVFFGAGAEAAALAGTMNAPGRMVLLMPRAVAAKVFGDAS